MNCGIPRLRSVAARCALGLVLGIAAAVGSAGGAMAAEIRVLSAVAFKPVLLAVLPAFEKRTGHKVVVDSDTAGALARRIGQGEDFDLAVLPPVQLEALGKEGLVSDGSITPLARVPGGPLPADALKATVYAGALSTSPADANAALALLVLLASEDTQALLKAHGMVAP
jgi:hypothetical protein